MFTSLLQNQIKSLDKSNLNKDLQPVVTQPTLQIQSWDDNFKVIAYSSMEQLDQQIQ